MKRRAGFSRGHQGCLLSLRNLLEGREGPQGAKAIEKKFRVLSITCLERESKPAVTHQMDVGCLCDGNLVVVSVSEIRSSIFIDVSPARAENFCICWWNSCFYELRRTTGERQVLIAKSDYLLLPRLEKKTIR